MKKYRIINLIQPKITNIKCHTKVGEAKTNMENPAHDEMSIKDDFNNGGINMRGRERMSINTNYTHIILQFTGIR